MRCMCSTQEWRFVPKQTVNYLFIIMKIDTSNTNNKKILIARKQFTFLTSEGYSMVGLHLL